MLTVEVAVGDDQKKELKVEDGVEVEEGIDANGNTVSLKMTCLERKILPERGSRHLYPLTPG